MALHLLSFGPAIPLGWIHFVKAKVMSWQWNRFALRTLLIGFIPLSIVLAFVAALVKKDATQRQTVTELLKFEGTVVALYGDYEYTPPPTITTNGISLILGRGQRVHGFEVRGEPSLLARLLVPIFGEYAFTEISAVYCDRTTSDDDLVVLAKVPHLRELDVSGTKITDDGMQHILRLKRLTVLDLASTGITERGLMPLAACSELRELDLMGVQVDESVVYQLRKALPRCDIAW
jgi:hypothetical protein